MDQVIYSQYMNIVRIQKVVGILFEKGKQQQQNKYI